MKPALILLFVLNAFAAADELPNQDALMDWHEKPDYVSSKIRSEQIPSKPFECADQNLYPTHPQQTLKAYHLYEWGRYDHHRLKGSDPACAIEATYSKKPIKPCLRAHTAYHVVLSDTFTNSCGQLFRGFMEVSFLDADESMGTLFSWGRTSYQDPRSDLPNDYVAGDTYPVARSRFLKLTEFFPGDSPKVESLRHQSTTTHSYNPETRRYRVHFPPGGK